MSISITIRVEAVDGEMSAAFHSDLPAPRELGIREVDAHLPDLLAKTEKAVLRFYDVQAAPYNEPGASNE